MTSQQQLTFNERIQLVLLSAALLSLLFVMYLLEHLLNPIGYGLIIGILIYPLRKQPLAKAALYASIYACGMWFIYDSGHLLIPFIFAYIIAFILNPVVVKFERHQIPRWLTASVFTIAGLLIIGLLFFFGFPHLLHQLLTISQMINEIIQEPETWSAHVGLIDFLNALGLDGKELAPVIMNHVNQFFRDFTSNASDISVSAIDRLGAVFSVLFFIVLLPFLLFFMIRDFDRIRMFVKNLVKPKQARHDYTSDVSRIVGAYVRGLFIVVIISAFNLSLGFTIIGLPYGLALGIFAGLTNFIPTLGLWISIFISTIVGISLGDPWFEYLPGIYLVFALEQIFESGFLVPRVMGHQVGIHPLLVMISLMIFGFMFGFLGVLIAVPTVALVSVFYEKYKETGILPFLSGADPDENESETPTTT